MPLYRLFRGGSSGNHFYTISQEEANNAIKYASYVGEGYAAYVASSYGHCSCAIPTVPVYRLYKSGKNEDHFYTASDSEAIKFANTLGYAREGIGFYCQLAAGCGATLPLYRYLRDNDHFYTTDIIEGNKSGGIFEGITCYVWPSNYLSM